MQISASTVWYPPIASNAPDRPIPEVPRYLGYFAEGDQLLYWSRKTNELEPYDGDPAEYQPIVV